MIHKYRISVREPRGQGGGERIKRVETRADWMFGRIGKIIESDKGRENLEHLAQKLTCMQLHDWKRELIEVML